MAKHSSLFWNIISNEEKIFKALKPDQPAKTVSNLTELSHPVNPAQSDDDNDDDDDDEDEGIGNGETQSEKDGETPADLKIDIEQVN